MFSCDNGASFDFGGLDHDEAWIVLNNREALKTNPFFKAFVSDPLIAPEATAAEIKQSHPYNLGFEIPALSYAAGGSVLVEFKEKEQALDMNYMATGWPADRLEEVKGVIKWRHSDYKNVAYRYTHKLFRDMVEKGELQ